MPELNSAAPRVTAADATAREEVLTTFRSSSFNPDELRARGGYPDDPNIIRLRGEGLDLIPSFQFNPDGTLNSHIQRINERLGNFCDTWAAAHWWITGNEMLIFEEGSASQAPINIGFRPDGEIEIVDPAGIGFVEDAAAFDELFAGDSY